MKNKELFLILSIFIFCIFLISFVSSEKMLTSDAGVQYDDNILKEFGKAKLNQSINDSEINQTSIRVIIYLKDYSETDAILSNFSEDEIWHIVDRNVSSRIGAIINEEGFYKLIQDERIDKIYYDFPVRQYNFNPKIKFWPIFGFILIILLMIYFIVKWLNKKIR